jgi:CxxC motif-containing protein
MIKEMICINCPRGCHLSVDTEKLTVTGNTCPRGEAYGKAEVTNPVRTVTSTVKIEGARTRRLSVKTDKPISKKLIFACMDEINKVEAKAPVNIGDVIIKNVCGTDVNIVATKKMEAAK